MSCGEMDRSGEDMTRAGKICGITSVAAIVIAMIWAVIALAIEAWKPVQKVMGR
jgi:hypothetical protein